MKINQIIVENFDGEYDDEAGMAQTNLHTIARAAQGLLDTIDDKENLPEWVQEKIAKVEGMMVTAWDYLLSQEEQGMDPRMMEAANPAQQAAIAISMKKAGKKPKQGVAEATGDEKFDKMIKGITSKKQVAKQQKTDTTQQARDAFNGMFGGGNPVDKLNIRKKGMAEGDGETLQQQKVRAAISKGLEVDKQKGDTEYKTRLDRSNKVGTVPGNYFDNRGYASDKLTGIDSILFYSLVFE